jgi:hypothetical protein
MSAQDSHLRLNRTEWLLTIGQALRADYDDLLEPLPDHLAALVERLYENVFSSTDSST